MRQDFCKNFEKYDIEINKKKEKIFSLNNINAWEIPSADLKKMSES